VDDLSSINIHSNNQTRNQSLIGNLSDLDGSMTRPRIIKHNQPKTTYTEIQMSKKRYRDALKRKKAADENLQPPRYKSLVIDRDSENCSDVNQELIIALSPREPI